MIKNVKIAEACESVVVGHVGSTSAYYTESGGVPFLRTQNVGDGFVETKDLKYVVKSFHDKLKKSKLEEGDVILSRVISDKIRCAIVPEELNGANCANIIVIKTGESTEAKYLKYFINSPLAQNSILKLKVGSAQSVINVKVVKNWSLPLPPLEQQKKIAAILDAADAYRQKTKALIAKYDELTQSLFLDMFGDPVTNPKGWDVSILNDCCSKISVGFVGTCEPFYCESHEGVPMVRTGNLGEGFLKLKNLKHVTYDFHEKQKKSQLKNGDLLIARHGDNGKAVLYNGEFKEANCLNIVILRPKDLLRSIFVQYVLNNENTRAKIGGRTGGATQKVINTKEIQKLDIPVPPIELQNQFAESVQAIETQKAQAQASLEKAEELFASLLQRAFKGELLK